MDIIEKCKREMERRFFSKRTIETYLFYISKFVEAKNDSNNISKKVCREFLEKCRMREYSWTKDIGSVSGSTLNVIQTALRFMMEEVLRKKMKLNLKYAKIPKKLPTYLSKEEVIQLINGIKNETHRFLISLLYGAGLRVSEVVKLRKIDFEIEQDIGWVREGKGKKDRMFIIPECLKPKLKVQLEKIDDEMFLFPGRKQTHLSPRTVQEIVKNAAKKAGIKKNIHPHTLRHSFATHVLEDGSDILSVQSLLGHSQTRTTMNYLHITKPKMINIKSPLDKLE